ncbi:hypothetical protein AB3M89_10040 [Microbacterium sp. 179-I 3D2 NHS]|uniref:hypothetical protein n=1 Tax=Microbacterium sp. 179-I 3D2 NHS TaxID=3235178 RepID=UPI0039A3E568
MTGEQAYRGRFDWLYAVAIAVGAILFATGVWLDVRDGMPTTQRGDQPTEVVLTMGLGCALFLSGIGGGVRALKLRRRSKASGEVHTPIQE